MSSHIDQWLTYNIVRLDTALFQHHMHSTTSKAKFSFIWHRFHTFTASTSPVFFWAQVFSVLYIFFIFWGKTKGGKTYTDVAWNRSCNRLLPISFCWKTCVSSFPDFNISITVIFFFRISVSFSSFFLFSLFPFETWTNYWQLCLNGRKRK